MEVLPVAEKKTSATAVKLVHAVVLCIEVLHTAKKVARKAVLHLEATHMTK